MDKLPAALAEVVEPLREADEYTRLQEIRQLGFYTLVTGLPMLFLLLAGLFGRLLSIDGDFEIDGAVSTGERWNFAIRLLILTMVPWIPFVVACFPRLFLPIVRRVRPDWQSPLVEAGLLKNSLEKQFWFQLPCALSYTLAVALAMLTSVSLPQVDLWQAALIYGGVVHLIVMPVLARQASGTGDAHLATVYRRLAWLAIAAFALAPFATWGGTDEFGVPGPVAILALTLLSACVVLPSIALGLYRLLAPRRWLLK